MPVLRGACLLGILSLAACSSTVVSKGGLDPTVGVQLGNPYSGLLLNVKAWRCLPTVAKEYSPPMKLLFLPVSASLLLADLPISAAADTVLLPIDFLVSPTEKPIRPLTDRCQ